MISIGLGTGLSVVLAEYACEAVTGERIGLRGYAAAIVAAVLFYVGRRWGAARTGAAQRLSTPDRPAAELWPCARCRHGGSCARCRAIWRMM